MTPKYKPSGKRFPSKSTSKSHPPQITNISSPNNLPLASGLDLEAENKFELELCWCIQQLELGVGSGKLVEKQMRDTQKNLELLKSNNVALVQKRQIMRSTLGNYRVKMMQEEKKHGKNISTVKFSIPKSNDNKFIFVRKARTISDNSESFKNENDSVTRNNRSSKPTFSLPFNYNSSSEQFTFNFNQPDT